MLTEKRKEENQYIPHIEEAKHAKGTNRDIISSLIMHVSISIKSDSS
jgi:hypothetical protein